LTVSRQSEIRQLEDLVVAVRGGRSRSLVVVGPAGIGKSWLCRRASELAEGFTVVATRGIESEAQLGYGGLFDVLSPLLDGRLDRLPPVRGDALRGALRIAETQGADPFAVAVATLDLLAMAAEDAPVLVVVDDAPWVDAASLGALRFAARRLDADRVAFLFAARSELAPPLLDAGLDSLTVEGLDTADAMGLINEFAGAAVEEPVARELAAASGGHPLWLREAARELSMQQRAGTAPLTDRFRSPASLQATFAQRVLSLAAQAFLALVVLGADERAPAPVTQQALADLGVAGDAIQFGIARGLVQLEAGRRRFSHPLAQAAAREAAAPAQRRLAHEALARAWGEAGERERAAWHLAEAGDGPDAHVSSALAGVARAARARGAPLAAAEAWRRAIETAPDADQVLGLRLERARDLAQAGRASEALVELDEILDRGRAADLRADAEILQGQSLNSLGRGDRAIEVLEAGAARIGESDPARATVMLCGAAFAKMTRGEMTAAVATAEAAVVLAGALGGASATAAKSTLGFCLIVNGEGARGYPLMLRHAERAGSSSGPTRDGLPRHLGHFACWMEDYDTARRELERAVAFARDNGFVGDLPHALSALGEFEFRVGNWVSARSLSEEALRLAEDASQFLHFAHIQLLLLAAVTGDADGARAYAEMVSTVAARSGSASLEIYAHAGRGLLELGLDRPQAAIAHLSRTRELAESIGIGEPNLVQWMPDLIESQIRAGLEPEARTTLAEFEAQAERTGRGWALASAARCRGLLAPPETADAIFSEAHRLVAALPSPFERARTELCWGERLRRDGRRVDARRHLYAALESFEALGAAPWAEKAARELRSSGGRAMRGPRARSDELTPQQMQIATMVAEGATNKSVANSLFLSPKTIEFHLGHVYRKLNISNRTQLARSLPITPAMPSTH
jgi:DNA-binding CsgD family transcriptional regulator